MGRNSEWPKMAVPNVSHQCFSKRWEEIQNGQKWLFQIFSNNFSQKDGKKLGMVKIRYSEFIQTFLVLKEWKKFGMDKIGTQAMGIGNPWNGS